MVVSTRICDLCGEEMSDYIPQVQIMGKPRGGWRNTCYAQFNDICPACHDKIFAAVLSVRKKNAAFRVNVRDDVDYDVDDDGVRIKPKDNRPHYKKQRLAVGSGRVYTEGNQRRV